MFLLVERMEEDEGKKEFFLLGIPMTREKFVDYVSARLRWYKLNGSFDKDTADQEARDLIEKAEEVLK